MAKINLSLILEERDTWKARAEKAEKGASNWKQACELAAAELRRYQALYTGEIFMGDDYGFCKTNNFTADGFYKKVLEKQ